MELVRTDFTYIHINDVCNMTWEMTNLWHFLFFIALLVMIQPQLFWGRGISQHGRPGNVTHSIPLHGKSSPCTLRLLWSPNTSNFWNASLSFYMTRQAITNLSKGVVLSEEQNNGNQRKMHCCKRVAYQAKIWTTSDLAQQQTPTPEGHGWTLDRESNSWLPVWTLPVASEACSELVKCACKSVKGCGARCSCKKGTLEVY